MYRSKLPKHWYLRRKAYDLHRLSFWLECVEASGMMKVKLFGRIQLFHQTNCLQGSLFRSLSTLILHWYNQILILKEELFQSF